MEMSEADKVKRDKRFEKLDEIDPDFKGNAQQMNPEEIDDRLAQLAKLDQVSEDALKADPTVNKLKEELKEVMTPIREDKKARKLMREYYVYVLEGRGKL
jgi:hypothetical protein